MKLQLVTESGVEILTASQSTSLHDFQILRSGLKKLLLAGKNRIILELNDTPSLPAEAMRELAAFDLLARELSGRVILAGVSAQFKASLEAFSVPPVVPCFESRAKALEYFKTGPKKAADESPSPPPAVAAAAQAGNEKRREEVMKREQGETGGLRKKIVALENENKALRDSVKTLTDTRYEIRDESSYREKIKSLEAELAKVLQDLEAKGEKKR